MISSLLVASPSIVLTLGSFATLMLCLVCRSRKVLLGLGLTTLVVALGLALWLHGKAPQFAFYGMIVHDPFGSFFSIFALATLLLGFLLTASYDNLPDDRRAEFCAILLAMGTGLIFMATSSHLLMAYIALETVSILSYTLAGFSKDRSASIEASMKYVIYGSLASCIMVFGISLIYGITGQLDIPGIRAFVESMQGTTIPPLLWIAVVMVFAGVGYKISAAPMHMWTPDVYEGAPTPVTAVFSVAPKAAGFALLLRILLGAFTISLGKVDGGMLSVITAHDVAQPLSFNLVGPFNWPHFLLISSVFTMFMGNLAALAQTSVKRILAYSSIAHAGYMLMGATTQTDDGVMAILFYVLIYCTMNLGAFWITAQVEEAFGDDSLDSFKGLAKTHSFQAVIMAIFMFSLTGLPPFAGFLAKFYLFSAVISRGMYGLAVIAALNAVISLYYYMLIVKAMFLEAPVKRATTNKPFEIKWAAALIFVLAIPNLIMIFNWVPVLNLAKHALVIFVR